VVGVGRGGLIARYLVPNMAETLITSFAVGVSFTIVAFSGLSFLGIGVQPPSFDWGQMLSQGVNSFYEMPAAALGPAAFIAGAALFFAFAGEALARASNPRLWTRPAGTDLVIEATALEPPPSALPTAPDAAISVRNLSIRLGGAEIVTDVSFD